MIRISPSDVFGFLKTWVDVHTMGMASMSHLLRDSGYTICIANESVMKAAEQIHKLSNLSLIKSWIKNSGITVLSFSYRLDPRDGFEYFCKLYHQLESEKLLSSEGGPLKLIVFSGLPDACKLIHDTFGNRIVYFEGGESALSSLRKYNIPEERLPKSLFYEHPYDISLKKFAKDFIGKESYKFMTIPDHYGYPECGKNNDSFVKRLGYCKSKNSLPLIRVHAGPYSPNRLEAIKEYKSWVSTLAKSKLLDVLSIGSSQLTQQHFGENWEGLPNGGGVPINSELEYRQIADMAKPMLVRTYAGTKDVPWMARMHERTLNISWHALSFWWFCKLDGRGDNDLLENLREHLETIKYIASTGKPLEPNVPHHFAFRGGDDISYIISGYLAAKTAKKYGIRHLILQNMLNTPKQTWGIQDLAKGRVMLRLIRELEDEDFYVHLQTRAGLDYFVPDFEEAKRQLAEITALMDDIEPDNENSPEIIHVVSYSEAVRLATPQVITESIKITLGALHEYRFLKKNGKTFDTTHDLEIKERTHSLYEEAKESINILEGFFSNLYSPEGLYNVFKEGFLPVPYLLDQHHEFPKATKWQTAVVNGGVKVIDEKGEPMYTPNRYRRIIAAYEG